LVGRTLTSSRSRAATSPPQDVLNRFVVALGGTLRLTAEFGDELKIA
jgi:hypothetical protein